ncbi:MAG: glycosyltransferase family 39 protein [Thermodesulfobacteriota bacterium]
MQEKDQRTLRAAYAIVFAAAAFRLLFSGLFLLTPDEANYWQWGRHLAWGYYDQAPLLGWAIGIFTRVFGTSETSVRLVSVLALFGTGLYLTALAGRFLSARAALATALLTQGVLELNAGGLLATPDGIQALAWAGASYHAACALSRRSTVQWLATGFWFGFGLLSKYTMVLFALCLLLYMLTSREHRKLLATPAPWAGVLLGSVLFSPVLWWNHQNGWSSARHVAHLGGADQGFTLHPGYLLELLGAQAGLVSPLAFLLIVWAWVRAAKKQRHEGWIVSFLLFTSAPMLLFFCVLSLHTRVYGNWPAASFLTASVLAAAVFSPAGALLPPPRPRLWKWTLATSYAVTALVLLQVVLPVLPLPVRLDQTAKELTGWNDLGREAGKMIASMPRPEKTFLFGIRYQLASELAFYTPGRPETVSINRWTRPNVYDYWFTDQDLMGMDAVGVTRFPDSNTGVLAEAFDRVAPPVPFPVFRKRPFSRTPELVTTFYLYKAYGFRGGLRWEPKQNDIRAQ